MARVSGVIRIASGQGFWGDRLDAPIEQVRRGPIDYLVLDYLAEVTMSILQKERQRDPALGYAHDFVPLAGEILGECVERGIRIVTNAGGVNLPACRDAVVRIARERGLAGRVRVATVTGDDLLDRLPELIAAGHELRHMETGEPLAGVLDRVRSANAYLGARPLARALELGAHVVLAGRAADASLTLAALLHTYRWSMDDHDLLAAGVVAGHLIECGAQATGGNTLIDWASVPDLADVGYPIAEVGPDGDVVITKHPGTGGRVDPPTVAEQLVYEIGDPAAYLTPDVVADFSHVRLETVGPDRVRVTDARGRPPPGRLKVSITYHAGWKAAGTLVYGWPDPIEKAVAADRILRERMDRLGIRCDEVRTEFVGWNATHGHLAGPPPAALPEVQLRIAVRSRDRDPVERFAREIAPLVLSGPPTVTGYAGGRPRVQEVVAFWPALVDRREVESRIRVGVTDA